VSIVVVVRDYEGYDQLKITGREGKETAQGSIWFSIIMLHTKRKLPTSQVVVLRTS